MKLRIKNNAKGERGLYIDGELLFIGSGVTRTFEKASASERDEAAGNTDFTVQSSTDGEKWEDHSPVVVPDQRQWLAIATDSLGANMRYVPLDAGEWFLGTAVGSEQPANPQGFTWDKIGGGAILVESRPVQDGDRKVSEGEFDPEAVIAGNAPDVIDALSGLSKEQLELLKIAETDREKPRKGVITAIDEALATADNS